MGVVEFLVVALGAISQGVAGMGFGLLCAPFLIGLYGSHEGVQQIVLLSLALNAVFLVGNVRSARVRDAVGLLLPAVLVAPLLAYALHGVNSRVLLLVAGLLTCFSAGLLWHGARWSQMNGSVGVIGAGVISAAMYALNAAWPASSVRPTLQFYGLGLNIVTLTSLGLPLFRPILWLSLAVGTVLGYLMARFVFPERVRTLVLSLAMLGGGLAIFRGLF